jgi:hypothetical protein
MVFNPQKNYAAWYEGISNVNIGRLLLNQVYGQTLPLLKDTVYRIKGEGAEE